MQTRKARKPTLPRDPEDAEDFDRPRRDFENIDPDNQYAPAIDHGPELASLLILADDTKLYEALDNLIGEEEQLVEVTGAVMATVDESPFPFQGARA